MNPQKNLMQQLDALHEVFSAHDFHLYNAQSSATLHTGALRVIHLMADCLNTVAPLAVRQDITRDIPGAFEYVSAFDRTRRGLKKILFTRFTFNWQVALKLNALLAPLDKLLMRNAWRRLDNACLLMNENGEFYKSINFKSEQILFCNSFLDASILFSALEARMVVTSMRCVEAPALHPCLLKDMNLDADYFHTTDFGAKWGSKEIIADWTKDR